MEETWDRSKQNYWIFTGRGREMPAVFTNKQPQNMVCEFPSIYRYDREITKQICFAESDQEVIDIVNELWKVKENNICPCTGLPCDDECCPPGATCNAIGGGLSPEQPDSKSKVLPNLEFENSSLAKTQTDVRLLAESQWEQDIQSSKDALNPFSYVRGFKQGFKLAYEEKNKNFNKIKLYFSFPSDGHASQEAFDKYGNEQSELNYEKQKAFIAGAIYMRELCQAACENFFEPKIEDDTKTNN